MEEIRGKSVSRSHKDGEHIGFSGASDKPSIQSIQERGGSRRIRLVKGHELTTITTTT